MKPILYLDIDDTLLMWSESRTREWWAEHPDGEAAPLTKEFLEWAAQTCEVRWLTSWAMSGTMRDTRLEKLVRLFDVPESMLLAFDNPLRWGGKRGKLEGINWDEVLEGREWAWVEDGLPPSELDYLKEQGFEKNYYYTNVSVRPHDLESTWLRLKTLWGPHS